MSKEKTQVIVYGVKFVNDSKLLHSAKCDFQVKNSSLDFNTCPIISAIIQSDVPHNFKIGTDFSVSVILRSKPNAIFPKGINNLTKMCQNCTLKHVERE